MKPKPKLRTFVASYAYDITCFRDFTVEATSELAAKRKLNRLLREGKFDMTMAVQNNDNISGHRVFIHGEAVAEQHAETMDDVLTYINPPK